MSTFSGPLTCPDVRQSLPLLVAGEAHAELRGRLHAHLATCEDCMFEWARLRAMAFATGALPVALGAHIERISGVLFPAPVAVAKGRAGVMWQRGSSCRTLDSVERQAMDRARRNLARNLDQARGQQLFAAPRPLRTRGTKQSSTEERPMVTVQVMDAAWEAVEGAQFGCAIFEGPSVSGAGDFRFCLEVDAEVAETYRGRMLICTLDTGEDKISFEARLESPRTLIEATELAPVNAPSMIDPVSLRLYLAPANYSPP